MSGRPTYNGMNVDEYARHYVQDAIRRGITVEQMVQSQHGRYGGGLRMDVGSGNHWNREINEVIATTKPGQMFVEIGDEWKVFDLRKLYDEVTSGAIQATLL